MQWSRGTFHENIQKNNTDSIGSLSLSDSILSGATITSQPAGYTFPHHLHSTIEIYRIISGECLMDVQSETLHCTKGDFIMILPNIVHSFIWTKSDCTFKHVHFDPNMFSNIILENEGVYPITLMHAVLFSSHFYYRFSADDVIDSTLDKLISLYTDSDGLFPAANINISLINLMLYILDHTKPAHHFQTRSSRTVMLLTRWIILRSIIPRRSYRKILRHSFIFLFAI